MCTGIAIGHLSTVPSELKVWVRSCVVREGRWERWRGLGMGQEGVEREGSDGEGEGVRTNRAGGGGE